MTLSPAGIRLGVLPPLALYVHIPWCVKKCPYCDFNSHQLRGDVPERAYVEALVSDLELALPDVWGRRVQPVLGGRDRSLDLRVSRAAVARRRLRDHPGSESRDLRGGKAPRLLRGRREPALDRHPELQPEAPRGARTHPRRRGSAARD